MTLFIIIFVVVAVAYKTIAHFSYDGAMESCLDDGEISAASSIDTEDRSFFHFKYDPLDIGYALKICDWLKESLTL